MYTAPIRIELPTIFGMKTVNAWLFLTPEPVLIDCGEKTDAAWDALVLALAQHQLKVSDLKKVIITHAHLDHMGLANQICQHSEAQIYVSEYALGWANNLETMINKRKDAFLQVATKNIPPALANFSFGKFKFDFESLSPYWDEIPENRIQVFPMNGTLDFGNATWQIIHAPGHCLNQVCFFNAENGHFLSADMLLNLIPVPIIDAQLEPPFLRTQSLASLVNSYQKIAQLPITKVFPGHYEAFENPAELIDNQLNRIAFRKGHCLELIKKGHHNFLELLSLVYPNRLHPGTFFMLVGFLDLLLAEGKIVAKEKDGLLSYRLKTKLHQNN